jgi:hypothetical protein
METDFLGTQSRTGRPEILLGQTGRQGFPQFFFQNRAIRNGFPQDFLDMAGIMKSYKTACRTGQVWSIRIKT